MKVYQQPCSRSQTEAYNQYTSSAEQYTEGEEQSKCERRVDNQMGQERLRVLTYLAHLNWLPTSHRYLCATKLRSRYHQELRSWSRKCITWITSCYTNHEDEADPLEYLSRHCAWHRRWQDYQMERKCRACCRPWTLSACENKAIDFRMAYLQRTTKIATTSTTGESGLSRRRPRTLNPFPSKGFPIHK